MIRQSFVARRDTVKFPGGPLSSEKIFKMNKLLGETPHLHVDLSLQFSLQRDELNMDRAAERGTRRCKLDQSLEN